jgi:phage replication-related protein YjqB (UPF0714/DUF867 family)
MTGLPDARTYRGYADLALAQRRGVDYRIAVRHRPGSPVAILAPHGGGIEDGTSEIATAIAAEEHNLYLFEGCRASYNYHALHLTSHRFDEPECLGLIARCERVVTIHGCDGEDPVVLIGGLDAALGIGIAAALARAGIMAATDGHRFPATRADNICNRGGSGRGVQLELPHRLRRGDAGVAIAGAVRLTLAEAVVGAAAPGPLTPAADATRRPIARSRIADPLAGGRR